MKKLIAVLTVLTLTFSIAGCGAQALSGSMQISRAQLTERDSELLRMVRGDYPFGIFDYKVSSASLETASTAAEEQTGAALSCRSTWQTAWTARLQSRSGSENTGGQ